MIPNNTPTNVFENGWIFRCRVSSTPSSHAPVLLLHGWTGDETSMWVFPDRLNLSGTIISPRAPYPATPAGFGWAQGTIPEIDPYLVSARELATRLQSLQNTIGINLERIRMIAFSQGTAAAIALTQVAPFLIDRMALISGFLPKNTQFIHPLPPAFIAHGTSDEIIPFEMAVELSNTLQKQGSRVTFCQADVGHKLSMTCYQGLDKFLNS